MVTINHGLSFFYLLLAKNPNISNYCHSWAVEGLVMNQDVCEPYISAVSSRLKKLTEANHSLAEIEILDGLFPRLLDLTKDVMAAEAASLMLYNPKLNQLEFASIKDDVV